MQAIVLLVIRRKILNTKDTRKVKVKPPQSFFQTEEQADEEEITYSEYDRREFENYYKRCLKQCLFTLFLHWKMKFAQPLIIQSLGPWMSLFTKPLILEYIRGKSMKRPFETNMVVEDKEEAEKKESIEKKKRDE